MDRRMDGIMHTRMDEGHFYSHPPPTLGDNYAAGTSIIMKKTCSSKNVAAPIMIQ